MCSFRLALAVGCVLALAACATAAPPINGPLHPNRLALGTVHTDAVAEARFLLFAPAANPLPKVKVDAPKSVKVLNTDVQARQFGPGNDFTCITVEIALDTAKACEVDGAVTVTAGDTVVKVPITATVKAKKVGQPRVLVVGTPFHEFSAEDGKAFKGWTDLVRAADLDVSYLLVRHKKPVLRDIDLSGFNCVLLSADALIFQDAEDVKRARAYVERGGRVVVTADSYMVGSVKGANAVLAGSGLEILDQEPPAAQKETTLAKADFAADVAKAGVASAKFFRASPITVEKGGRVLASAAGYGTDGWALAATAKVGKGEVVALGVSLWATWVGDERAAGTDNAKLLRWLLVPPQPG